MEEDTKSEAVVCSSPKHRFYFESDCLALKNNPDYQKLLKTLAVLEAQKMQAVKVIATDLEELIEVREKADKDPHGFVEALKSGILKSLPQRQSVEVIPEVNWKSYTDSLQQVVQQKSAIFMNTRKQTGKHQWVTETNTGAVANLKASSDTNKPSSYRQPWTAEEQTRFEELLKIYPPEAVERRRFDKIANALGSRTTQQVASHVQKYFIKLANAGLPVPGRMPNMVKYMKSKRHRNKYSLNRPSTFFSSLSPRVYMTDGSNTTSAEGSMCDESSDDESMLSDTDSSLKELFDSAVVCSSCDSEVRVGIYWQCMDCTEQTQLCTACVNSDFHSGVHTSTHDMRVFSVAPGNSLDKDYTNFTTQTQYNYLDPNFFPSS